MNESKTNFQRTPSIPLSVNLIVSDKNDKPILEIRKVVDDPEAIKTIIMCAFDNIPIIVQPAFRNRINAIGALLDKGIIRLEGDGQYYFNF